MTTLPHRTATALLVIDMQRGVVVTAHERAGVVARIGTLAAKARQAGVPVVWVQHDDADLPKDSEAWRLVPELVPAADEVRIEKQEGNAFTGTGLEAVLAARVVGHLVIAGAETDACITATLDGAFARGYDVTLVADAHTTSDSTATGAPSPAALIATLNQRWADCTVPGQRVIVANAADVVLQSSTRG